MKRNCPNLNCHSPHILKNGFYFRRDDSRKIQRFKCKNCKKEFSASTGTHEYNQKKRRVNYPLLKLLNSKMTQRKIADFLNINPKTVARKFDYLGVKCAEKNETWRKRAHKKALSIQIDDLITKEKTKLKPLSISIAVDADSRNILDAQVSVIPAFGHLAEISRRKYGPRKSEHKKGLDNLFKNLKLCVSPFCIIKSDQHKNYPEFIQRYFPKAEHESYKSERGCVAGQGELKKTKFDPIFNVNHTLATVRDNVSTTVRRSWCVTQSPVRLQYHMEIFIYYMNQHYLKKIHARRNLSAP